MAERHGVGLLRAPHATEQKSRVVCAFVCLCVRGASAGAFSREIAFANAPRRQVGNTQEGLQMRWGTRWNVPLTSAANCAKLTRRWWPSCFVYAWPRCVCAIWWPCHRRRRWKPPLIPASRTIFWSHIFQNPSRNNTETERDDFFNNFISGIFARYKTLNGRREVASDDNMTHWEFIFPKIHTHISIYIFCPCLFFSIFLSQFFVVSLQLFFVFLCLFGSSWHKSIKCRHNTQCTHNTQAARRVK